jgi:hypothetical protein
MKRRHIIRHGLILALVSVLLPVSFCSGDSPAPQDPAPATTLATGAEIDSLPASGKLVSPTAPPKAVFGMIWIDSTTNQEYIFDGNGWVPHDQSVDSYTPAQ